MIRRKWKENAGSSIVRKHFGNLGENIETGRENALRLVDSSICGGIR